MSILKKTAGSILVVSTLILSMLAGLSIATMQNVVTEYQLSNHDQDKTLALQSAQYALAEAKRLLLTQWAPGATPCAARTGCVNNSGLPVSTNGIAVWRYAAFAGSSDFAQQPASYFTSAAQVTPNLPNSQVAIAPRFFVIDLGCDPYAKANSYRIVAMGFGASATTTAYAESQLTIPLTGQNSYTNAPTTAVYGVGVTANATPTRQIYQLARSTNSKLLFLNTGSNVCGNAGQSRGTGATCEQNCAGEVRVKAYSRYNTNSCTWVYGDWVSGSNQSVLTLKDSSSTTATVSCGPCQTAMAVPTTACASGQYNSCTGSCVALPDCTQTQNCCYKYKLREGKSPAEANDECFTTDCNATGSCVQCDTRVARCVEGSIQISALWWSYTHNGGSFESLERKYCPAGADFPLECINSIIEFCTTGSTLPYKPTQCHYHEDDTGVLPIPYCWSGTALQQRAYERYETCIQALDRPIWRITGQNAAPPPYNENLPNRSGDGGCWARYIRPEGCRVF